MITDACVGQDRLHLRCRTTYTTDYIAYTIRRKLTVLRHWTQNRRGSVSENNSPASFTARSRSNRYFSQVHSSSLKVPHKWKVQWDRVPRPKIWHFKSTFWSTRKHNKNFTHKTQSTLQNKRNWLSVTEISTLIIKIFEYVNDNGGLAERRTTNSEWHLLFRSRSTVLSTEPSDWIRRLRLRTRVVYLRLETRWLNVK